MVKAVPQQFLMLEIAYDKVVAALRHGRQVRAKKNPKATHLILIKGWGRARALVARRCPSSSRCWK